MSSDLARFVLVRLDVAILCYFLVVNLAQALLLIGSGIELRRHLRERRGPRAHDGLGSPLTLRVSLLAPAYNEEAMIVETVTAMLAIRYPRLEVVVVNDGSSDRTLSTLIEHFDLRPIVRPASTRVETRRVRCVYGTALHPQLVVVDKENGGKADALNVALCHASGDLVCAVDADTVIEPNAIEELALPMLEDEDVVAAGGVIRVANGCSVRYGRVVERRAPRHLLAGLQEVEYSRAFLFGRLGWNRLGGNLIISGAFGLFRRAAVLDANGYVDDTVGEDMELVLRLRRRAYETGRRHRVVFVPNPIAWTEVPESVRTLARQRNRWHRGLYDVLARHARVLGNPRYRAMGLVVAPYFVFIELMAPVIEAVGLIGLAVGLAIGAVQVAFAFLFALVAYGIGVILSLVSLAMEDALDDHHQRLADRLHRHARVVVEQFGYRQLTVAWRLWGLARALVGDRRWGTQSRRGFDTV